MVEHDQQFWDKRSEKYNNLQWVNDDSYLDAFIRVGGFCSDDKVLDVGSGTGVIAHAVAPLAGQVIALDISQAMLNHGNWKDNKYFIQGDIREKFFHDDVFDKVTARMVFHHILEGTQLAMNECFRVLKPGGKLILAEGVPPTRAVKPEYTEIFKLKEDRLVFLEEDLVGLFETAGFKNIQVYVHITKEFSVKNWLDNAGYLSEEVKSQIFDMHTNSSDIFKEAYNLTMRNGDCLIETKNLIVVGEK